MGFDQVLRGFIGFYWVILLFYRLYRLYTGYHLVLMGFIGFNLMLPSFTVVSGLYWLYTGYHWVLVGFTKF